MDYNVSNFDIYRQKFPHPYNDISSSYIPNNMKKVLHGCEAIYYRNGIILSATNRIAQYFVTEIKANDPNKIESSKELIKILNKKKENFILAAIESIVYGNSINVIYFPIKRMFQCPCCKIKYSADVFEYKMRDYWFCGKCPKCEYVGKLNVYDEKIKDPNKINIIRFDPKSIDIDFEMFSGKSEYYWKIDQDTKNKVLEGTGGNKLFCNNVPLTVLEALKNDDNFKINENYLFHLKTPSLSGINAQWGFPKYLTIMRNDYYSSVLKHANEAIALDFIIPFRVISPGSAGGEDPLRLHSMAHFGNEMRKMIDEHRIDPANFQIAPYPIQYQAFGAEKKALDVTAEIRASDEEQLHALNYPAELFFNTLQIQALPTALRLFENSWAYLVQGLNDFLQWKADHICNFMGWDKVDLEFTKVTIADDIEKRQVFLQLAAAQQISSATAFKPYGLDFKEEQQNIANQYRIQQEIQRDAAKDIQEESMIAGAPSATGMSPTDQIGLAYQKAQELLMMPYEIRRSEMHKIKQADEAFYAIVKSKMEEIRGQAKSQQSFAATSGGMMPPGQMG